MSFSKDFFFVAFSAVLSAASFLCMSYLWWLHFIFLVPLFAHTISKYTFLYGFMWGCIVYTALHITLWQVCWYHAVVWWWFLIPLVLVVWFSFFSGLWLFVFYYTHNKMLKLLSTTLFFVSMQTVVLSPLSWRIEGYPFVSPLLSLFYGGCLGIIAYTPLWAVYFLLVLLSYFIAQFFWKHALLVALCLLFPQIKNYNHDTFKNYVCAVLPQELAHYPYERAQQLRIACENILLQYPYKKIIVFPESAFAYDIVDHSYIKRFFDDIDNKIIVFGGYRQSYDKLFNTAFLLHKCRITHYYDKQYLVNFFECNHPLLKNSIQPFLNNKKACSAGNKNSFFMLDSEKIIPLICSEVFWHMPYNKKVLALVNDAYFNYYFARILYTTALFNAYKNKTSLFYCGYKLQSK